MDDTPLALVVVFHHVLADGIGGLAVLARLLDGAPTVAATGSPRPAPTRRTLAVDAFRTRLTVLSDLSTVLPTLRQAATELKPSARLRAPVTTLNAPTGGRRQLAVTRADLAQFRHTAHAHGATINDVVLTAITGAVATLLDRRGEPVDDLVVSVPVSARSSAIASDLGNRVGVMPVRLPATGNRIHRLEQIAIITRAHKGTQRGASAAILAPIVRLLAALRLWHWFVDHQRLVNLFETNLRGPNQQLRFGGVPITDVIPITTIAGNVSLSFAAISYAGTMVVTIMADPDRLPDLNELTTGLQHELDQLTQSVPTDTP
jgi:WS/DGAT/MGAT family acyltransferase